MKNLNLTKDLSQLWNQLILKPKRNYAKTNWVQLKREARKLRTEKGLTLSQIATTLGVARGTVGIWLNGIAPTKLTNGIATSVITRGRKVGSKQVRNATGKTITELDGLISTFDSLLKHSEQLAELKEYVNNLEEENRKQADYIRVLEATNNKASSVLSRLQEQSRATNE